MLYLLILLPPAHFGAQKCHKIGPFTERNWKFAHCHIFDIIMQHIPAKLQMSWTCGSKFMRPPSFRNPKRVIAPEWDQIGPKLVLPVFQVEITRNHDGHRPNLKPNGWTLLYLGPTALSGTQNCPIPIGLLRDRN